MENATSYRGTIEKLFHYSDNTGWAAGLMRCDKRIIRISGIMAGVRAGMGADVEGRWKDGRYGQEFVVTRFSEQRPSDVRGIEAYLASGLIRDIGKVLAGRIVERFGDRTLDILDNEPERLREVPGIGRERVNSIIKSCREQRTVRDLMVWLKKYGVTNGLAVKIYKAYGDEAVKRIEEDPYLLADDIRGVGFHTADGIAQSLGLPADSPRRIISGLKAVLTDAALEGDTCMMQDDMTALAASGRYLRLPVEKVAAVVAEDPEGIITEGGYSFLPYLYWAEKNAAARFAAMLTAHRTLVHREADIEAAEKACGYVLDERQKEAVRAASRGGVAVITGGPGTGKTTTMRAILAHFESIGAKVELAAPTGRAAKRMKEATGHDARTIHRLLEWTMGAFGRDDKNPLDGNVLIVDETSMLDATLLNSLMQAVPATMSVIFVGDADQLPSVGAGCVLRDLCECGLFPVVHLEHIYRQEEGSAIVEAAHRVNAGEMPHLHGMETGGLMFIREGDRDAAAEAVVRCVAREIERGAAPRDVQVLCPMRREGDVLASAELNGRLQELLCDGRCVAKAGSTEFRIGDRIMQVVNDYDKDIFNGDMGVVTGGASEQGDDKIVLTADFDGRTVMFRQADLQNIVLAYATTIHKSQGSEFPVVIMPIHESQTIMLKRNLLYTGLTRARRRCIIIGTEKAVATAASRVDGVRRLTAFNGRLQAAVAAEEGRLAEEMRKTRTGKKKPKETPDRERELFDD